MDLSIIGPGAVAASPLPSWAVCPSSDPATSSDLHLPVEPCVREGRDALVRWAVLLEEVIR